MHVWFQGVYQRVSHFPTGSWLVLEKFRIIEILPGLNRLLQRFLVGLGLLFVLPLSLSQTHTHNVSLSLSLSLSLSVFLSLIHLVMPWRLVY